MSQSPATRPGMGCPGHQQLFCVQPGGAKAGLASALPAATAQAGHGDAARQQSSGNDPV